MIRLFATFALALALLQSRSAFAQDTPPPLILDTAGNSVGIAQQTAHAEGLQARIQWIDGGANIGNLNTHDKVLSVVAKIKAAGMNMIVMDVKPIVGETLYPSKYATKLPGWKGQTLPADFDLVGEMVTAAHAAGLSFYANMSTFGEGHKVVSRGPGYTHPEWQTILYEVNRSIASGSNFAPISIENDLPQGDQSLSVVTNASLLRKNRPGTYVTVLNFDSRVVGVYDGDMLSNAKVSVPVEGAALLGKGRAADWLRRNAPLGKILTYHADPKYVPVVDAPEQKYTIFCDPSNPEVRQHEWDVVREVVTNYPVDGMVFDDRLRYAALNADFGPHSRAAFEQFVGHMLHWPGDVFTTSPYPGQQPVFGTYYQQWLDWRAGNVKSWLTEAARIVRATRPQAQVGVYVGSWYGDYEKVASNWAADDFAAPYHWMTPEYQKTGYAGLLDWLTTGCYYEAATINEARTQGVGLGATVEAAGQLSNIAVNDSAWTYAGLYVLSYQGHPEKFARALRAAAASTQGVMVFDLSQIIDFDWWQIEADAFASTPATSPNLVPGLLEDVRRQHAQARAAGTPPPAFPPYLGIEDTGF